MKQNLEFSKTLTYHQGYADYNIIAILLFYCNIQTLTSPSVSPGDTEKQIYKTKNASGPCSVFCGSECHKNKALALPCPCPLKVPQCVESSQAGAQDFGKDNSVNACWLYACHSSRCGVIRVCLVFLLGGCKQSGRCGPFLPCLLVRFCNVFAEYFYCYFGKSALSDETKSQRVQNGNYIYPIFTAVHTSVLGAFHVMFDCSPSSHDTALRLNVGVKWDMHV